MDVEGRSGTRDDKEVEIRALDSSFVPTRVTMAQRAEDAEATRHVKKELQDPRRHLMIEHSPLIACVMNLRNLEVILYFARQGRTTRSKYTTHISDDISQILVL